MRQEELGRGCVAPSSEDEQSGEARTCVVEENEGRRKETKTSHGKKSERKAYIAVS